MKRLRLSALILSCTLASSIGFAAEPAEDDVSAEEAAIVATARDYIDGWFEGNAERMNSALHPDLAKRTVQQLPNEREFLLTLSQNTMVEYTRAGYGTKARQDGQVNEVIILDRLEASASVKTVCPIFIDYLHLAKINGEWKIVNVLWENVAQPDQGE